MLALALAAVGCNGDPPELSPPPVDLESTQNLVLEGTMSPGLDAYELGAELTFYGVGIGEHNRECETYGPLFSTANVVEFVWSRRTFKQRRGVFSRSGDGTVRFVVPLDLPALPSCDWEVMELRLMLVRDGREAAALGTLSRYFREDTDQEANTDIVRLQVAVACATGPERYEGSDPLRCVPYKYGGTLVETVPVGAHEYKFDIRFVECPEDPDGFWECFLPLDTEIQFPDDVRLQSSIPQ